VNDDRSVFYDRLESELSLMWRNGRAYSVALARQVHPGLDGAGYSLMVALDGDDVVRAADLVVRFGVDKSTISRQLTHLSSLGLVERVPDASDRRALVVRLTATGEERLHAVREARRGRIRGVLDDWPADDVRALGDLLGRLNVDLGRIS
jgi:DNA-binding MarR family transcriptional regulator